MITTADAEALAAACYAEAQRHPARSPERRAAAHAWSALVTSPTVTAAQRAVRTFGDPATQEAALQLLGRIAAHLHQEGTDHDRTR